MRPTELGPRPGHALAVVAQGARQHGALVEHLAGHHRLDDARRAAPASSAQRYCSRRSSTLPETGPSTRARKRPCSAEAGDATPASAQKPSSGGAIEHAAEADELPSVWIGTRPRSAPSTETTTFAPSLLR